MNRPQDGKAPSHCGSLHAGCCSSVPTQAPHRLIQSAFPHSGMGLVLIGTVTRHQDKPGKGPSCAGSSWAGLGHTGSRFALMLHLFWDKTGCQHQGQAAWHCYHHLENRNRIKSCPAPALGTEDCCIQQLTLLTLRGKFGHWTQETYSHLQAVTEELILKLNPPISFQPPLPA